jgi:hypothetical protein
MLSIKKSSLKITSLISISTLFLSTTSIVKAEKAKYSSSDLSSTSSLQQDILYSQQKPEFILFSDFNIAQPVSIVAQHQISTNESGAPSLRRQPTGGKKFEPTRIPLQIPFFEQPYRSSPSITIINPSAYGAAWGNVGIGFGFQERVRFVNKSDGVIGLGFGLGDPQKNIGAQIGISLVDVSAPFRDGVINLKLHRRLSQDFAVALGVQGLTTWGNTDGGSSVYGVVTKRFKLRQDKTKLFSEIYTSLGVGGGQFRSESNINNGKETVGVFSSLAVRVIEPISFVTEWSGQDLTIGTPIVLFKKLPLVIVPGVTDITGTAGNGARFIFGIGYTFSF